MRRPVSPRIVIASLALAVAAVTSLILAPPESLAGSGPPGVVNRRGYPRLAILRSGGPPADPASVEALHRNFAMADLIVFGGVHGKWWPLPTDASGFTLRSYNRRMKILEYLALDIFDTAPPTGLEPVPPPTDPEAALHTSNFTRDEFYVLARALGGTTYPVLAQLDAKWAGAIQKTDYGSRYATWVFANWKSRAFRDYVKAAMAEVGAAGFDGMFFDFGALTYLAAENQDWWIVMPPNCFRLKSSGWWYWMSYPGQRFEQDGPPPDPDAVRAMDPVAIDALSDVDFCSTTGAPAEITSQQDAEMMIADFYAELGRSSLLLKIWNGANGCTPRRIDIALTNSEGAHQEGFALRAFTPQQIRDEMDRMEFVNARRKIFIAWNRETGTQGLIFGYVACMIPGGINTYCEFSNLVPAIPEIQLDPGTPRGHYVTLPAGETDLEKIVYKRVWSKATMYLNPTSSVITVDGISIGAKSGLILPPPSRSAKTAKTS